MTTQTTAITLYDLLSATDTVPEEDQNVSTSDQKEGNTISLPSFNFKPEVTPLTLLAATGFGVLAVDVLIELGIAGAAMGGLGLITAALSAFGVLSIGAMLLFVTADFFNLRKA